MDRYNQTFTNSTKRAGAHFPEWHLYLWYSVSMFIGAAGGILILLLLLVMYSQKKLTTGSGLLIAHAQFIDFIMCVIENPLQNTGLLFQVLHISMATNCPFTRFSLISMQAVGNWTNVFVAVNRFVAVVTPYYYQNIVTRPLLIVNILLGTSDMTTLCRVSDKNYRNPELCTFNKNGHSMKLYWSATVIVFVTAIILLQWWTVDTAFEPRRSRARYRTLESGRAFTADQYKHGWGVALAITIPHYVLKVGVEFGLSPTGTCVIVKMDPFMFRVISTFVFYLPIGIVGILYGIIYAKWLYLRRRHRVDPGAKECGMSPVIKKRFSIARVLMMTFLWYCVCYFPATFLPGFFYHIYKDDKRIEFWGKTLLYLGYAANPLFFFAMSTEYRTGARKVLQSLCAVRIRIEISKYKRQRESMQMNNVSEKVAT